MRRCLLVLTLLLSVLALAAAGCGGDDDDDEAAPPAETAQGETTADGEFGETYDADEALLTKALFDPSLLPEDESARNVVLAAFARASKEVDTAKALDCWKNNGCDTGTGGEKTVAYADGFGENVFREVAKMEFILQALTYPEVGKIIYTTAQGDPTKAIADLRSLVAQDVDVIIGYPDAGDAVLPAVKEATEQGIPYIPYAWGYIGKPGEDYLTIVGEDTCVLGESFAEVMNTEVGSGDIGFLGGFPGNPLSKSWQDCERPKLESGINVVGTGDTNWTREGALKETSALLAKSPNLKGISYEYADGFLGGLRAYEAANKPLDLVLTLRTDETGLFCQAKEIANPNFKIFYFSAGAAQTRIALTAGMMKIAGAEIPPTIVLPVELQEQSERDACVPGIPPEASGTSLVPVELFDQMYPS